MLPDGVALPVAMVALKGIVVVEFRVDDVGIVLFIRELEEEDSMVAVEDPDGDAISVPVGGGGVPVGGGGVPWRKSYLTRIAKDS